MHIYNTHRVNHTSTHVHTHTHTRTDRVDSFQGVPSRDPLYPDSRRMHSWGTQNTPWQEHVRYFVQETIGTTNNLGLERLTLSPPVPPSFNPFFRSQ